MGFDLKSFAAQVRPSPRRSSPEAFDNSVFDAGSPQYVRPEDLCLDIQAQLFGLPRESAQDLGGIEPPNFRNRWLQYGAGQIGVERLGAVQNEHLADALMGMLRCSQRKKEHHPTLLPLVPAVGFYKNIKPNLPNFLNDQLRPALSFADEGAYTQRISNLKERLCIGTYQDDNIKQLAVALLSPPGSRHAITLHDGAVTLHDGPLLKDYSVSPSRPLPICLGLAEALETLVDFEAMLPRVIWTRWLTAMLRLWLPLFFLRRCAVTAAAANVAKGCIRKNNVPTAGLLTKALLNEEAILRGSKEWLNQLTPAIQSYVRARFELSILVDLSNLLEWLKAQAIDVLDPAHENKVKQKLADYEVDPRRPSPTLPSATGILEKRRLSMPSDGAPGRLPFDEWLRWAVANRPALDVLARYIGAEGTVDLVERVYAYIRPDYEPMKSGFTKNMREFVVYNLGAPLKADRDPEFPDEFNLIYRGETGRRARQVSVYPGPQLLALLVQLVSHRARATSQATAKLSDLLKQFDNLGLDFRSNPDDFENLKSELLRLNLLQSSADAAEAASLKTAFSLGLDG